MSTQTGRLVRFARRRLPHLLAAAIAGGSAFAAMPVLAQAANTSIQSFNISGGQLDRVLNEFAAASGVVLSVDAAMTAGKQSQGLKGEYTVVSGFRQILIGSGLQAVQQSNGSYSLLPVPSGAGSNSGASVLPNVRVDATGESDSPVGPDFGYRATRSRSATKSDTPLIETPQAISVITRDQITDRDNVTLSESLRNVAGVTANEFFGRRGRDDVIIRGFTQSNFLLRDGLRQYTLQFFGNEPWGLERIEVIKGPASVLYGQLPPGGLVNVVSKRPQFTDFNEVLLGYGSYDSLRLGLDLNRRASENSDFAWRLNVLRSEGEDAIDFVDRERTYVAPSLTWQPSAATSLTFLAMAQDSKQVRPGALPAVGTLLPNSNGQIPLERFVGEPEFEGDGERFREFQIGYVFEHKFKEGLSFRQNLRHSDARVDSKIIFPGALQADQRTLTRRPTIFDQEVRSLVVDNQVEWQFGEGRLKHTLIGGLDYFGYDQDQISLGGTVGAIDLFNPVYGSPVTITGETFSLLESGKQYGLYLQDQMKLDEKWVGVFGLRRDEVKIDSFERLSDTLTVTDASKTTGRAGLLYLADNGLAPYISYATSFVPVAGADFSGNPFKPEEGEQVELGVKYEPAGKNLSFTAAVYDLVRSNVSTTDPNNPGFSIQVGEQQHKGIELEVVGQIARGMSLSASYSYIDAEVTVSNTGNQGNKPTVVPLQNSSLWFKHDLQNADWAGWSYGAGVRYVGRSFADAANTLTVPSFMLFDAALYYRLENWRLALHAKNLTDERYISSCFSTGAACYPGEYRTVSVSANLAF
ncbi:MAG: TonB-dependent siderophore receptor [Pseudomonadota bacterium]